MMNSFKVLSALLLSLTISTSFSFGFLQQKSEKYYSIAAKNDGDYLSAKESRTGESQKPLTRNSRSIHVLFPPNGDFYVPPTILPSPMPMISSTTTSRSTSRRPPKQYPGIGPNTSKDKQPQLPGSKDCYPNCGCSTQYIPYCASNNITYRNKCQLNCAQQKCDSGIRRKFEGVCPVPYVHHQHKPHRKLRYLSYSNY